MGGSVHQDKKSGKWFISVYFEGKRYKIFRHPVSLEPFRVKESAKKQLSYIQVEIDQHTFIPRAWLPDSPLSIKEYSKDWLKTLDISKKTLQSYKTAINKYIAPYFGNKDIRNIRYNDIVKFKNSLPLEPKGVYNIIGTLKKLLRDAWRNEDIVRVPPFPKLSYSTPEIEYLTIEQQDRILQHIPIRYRPIFEIMMEYGLRVQEARALQRDCIKNGRIYIKRVFSDNELREGTKSGDKGKRSFAITDHVKDSLAQAMHTNIVSQFVFTRADGKPYTSKNLNAIWHEAEEKAGIKCKLYNAVRHSLGCQLLDQGEDLDIVREILGHTKAEMTRRYAKRKVSKLDKAIEKRRKIIEINGNVATK